MHLFALVKRKKKYKIIDCSEINMFDMNLRSLGDLSSISGIQYHTNNGSLKSCLLIAISGLLKIILLTYINNLLYDFIYLTLDTISVLQQTKSYLKFKEIETYGNVIVITINF
jgi:hypothetical protein